MTINIARYKKVNCIECVVICFDVAALSVCMAIVKIARTSIL